MQKLIRWGAHTLISAVVLTLGVIGLLLSILTTKTIIEKNDGVLSVLIGSSVGAFGVFISLLIALGIVNLIYEDWGE